MTAVTEDQKRTVVCPQCGRGFGLPCRGALSARNRVFPRPMGRAHPARKAAYVALRAADAAADAAAIATLAAAYPDDSPDQLQARLVVSARWRAAQRRMRDLARLA